MTELELRATLDAFYREITSVIIDKQNPVTGLLPASTAVNSHGDYRDAWVRDNVYSILAVWGLGVAYRALDEDDGRGRELTQRTVHLMRGLLRSMMAQSSKVEAFKKSRHPTDALHAKYDTETGGTVVSDEGWGHLQIDATSLYLLMLAQMTASGLEIIWTRDEADFIQNLVYYIERAYRTPDFGIWERGAKSNHGRVELNASSLGMAKAALEAMDGFRLMGARGAPSAVVHVSPDNIAQSEITLHAMLPRESHSKEVDAALLSVIGFPAFAVHDRSIRQNTKKVILEKLSGKYGLKRFLRDGHQTVLEDEGRLHYEAEELKKFENIESEWPLFFTYLYLDAIFTGDPEAAELYEQKIAAVVLDRGGQKLVPELYFVAADQVEQEKAAPGSTERVANDNVPLVWAQSLYLLGRMMRARVLRPGHIDPLGRRRHKRTAEPVVQILLLAEDANLQAELASQGVPTETPEDIAPVALYLPEDVTRIHAEVGKNPRLRMSGRSNRTLKSLTTSRVYQINGSTSLCLAPFFLEREFYLAYDLNLLTARFRAEVAYIRRHWSRPGRPTVTILLTHNLLSTDRSPLYRLFREAESGLIGDSRVRLGSLHELLPTASYEHLQGISADAFPSVSVGQVMHPAQLLKPATHSIPLQMESERDIEDEDDEQKLIRKLGVSNNLYERLELLTALAERRGIDATIDLGSSAPTVRQLVLELYEDAGRARYWSIVRHAAGLLRMVDVDLFLSCAALLVAHKNVQVGRAYDGESLITEALPDEELLNRIDRFCRDDIRDRVLTQEILLYLGVLVRARPALFADLLTVRVAHLIGLMVSQLSRETQAPIEEAYNALLERAPSEVESRLEAVLEHYAEMEGLPQALERVGVKGTVTNIRWAEDPSLQDLNEPEEGWHAWRQLRGVVDRRAADFHARLWKIFEHLPCLVIGDRFERRSRVESRLVLSDMTPGERSFALMIEHLLNKVPSPEYRQLNLEALTVLASFFEQHPAITLTDALYLDAMIGHAVRLHYIGLRPERAGSYDQEKAEAWRAFYAASPRATSGALIESLRHLMTMPSAE